MNYLYSIERATDGSYSAYIPNLAGCTMSAETKEALEGNIRNAVAT